MSVYFDKENPNALLCELVQPRADWFDMDKIAGMLPALVAAFEQISLPIEGAEEFLNWVRSGEIEETFHQLEEHRKGVRGLVGDYPQHAGLRAFALNESRHAWLPIAAYVIHTASDWRAEIIPSERQLFEKRLEGAWRALRLLSDKALTRVPQCSKDVEHFTQQFAKRNERLDRRRYDEMDIRYLEELQRFFKFSIGEGRIVHYKPGAEKFQLSRIQKVGAWQFLEGDFETEVGDGHQVFVHVTLPKESEQARLDHHQACNAPDELVAESFLLTERESSFRVDRGEAPEVALKKLQPKRAAFRRSNSFLPWRWESLNEFERNLVLETLFKGGWGSQAANELVALMLLTGRSLESVSRAQVVQNRTQLPATLTEPDRIYLIRDDQAWATSVLAPPERRKSKAEWTSQFEVTQKGFIAPIPAALWQVLAGRADNASKRVKKRSGKLFSANTSIDDLAKDIACALTKLNKAKGARITLKRIQNCLFEGMLRQTTDTVDACLVTGRHLPCGQSANLYYHTRAVEALTADYADVVNAWLVNLGRSSPSMAPAHLDFGLPRVGSPFCLRPEVIRDVVSRLRAQIAEYRKTAYSSANIRKFHNLFTAYVILQVMWSTGFRAVRDPIAHPHEFNERRGFVIIADKVDDNFGHSRLVYLPKVVIEQLRSYETHRQHMTRRLKEVGVKAPIKTFFVFLDAKLQSEFATPKRLADELQWTFPWPLNVNRHSLRGFLRDRGIPGYLVDVFMGHWGVGTEPLSKYSSLDLFELKNRIVPATTALLNELGFGVEVGIDA